MGMGSESHHGNGMDLPPGGVSYGAHLAELNIAVAKDRCPICEKPIECFHFQTSI